jgi:hypothetical protein
MRVAVALLTCASCVVTACASTPDMRVGYYLPTGSTDFKAVETIACDPDFHVLGVVNATITSSYRADRSRQVVVPIKKLDGAFSDTTVGFDFYDDGRLKGLNAETTGQGEAIVKAAAAIFSNLILAVDGGGPTAPDDCKNIAKWGGDKKVLSLTYVGSTTFSDAIPQGEKFYTKALEPETNSFFYWKELQQIGSVCSRIGPSVQGDPVGNPVQGTKDSSFRLELRQPAVARVEVVKFAGPNCSGDVLRVVSSAEVQVPQNGSPQFILLPRAAVFGKQSVNLTLSEAGAITKLGFGKTNGTAAALNAFGAAAGAVDETRAERLTRLKEEADLIVAQERLVKCLADNVTCK